MMYLHLTSRQSATTSSQENCSSKLFIPRYRICTCNPTEEISFPFPASIMAESTPKPYDLTIFGASGFTGKYVIREALKFLNTPSSPLKTLALAGRNPSKLTQSLNWASPSPPSPSSISIIKADISDPSSLNSLCTQSKVLLNCVGPFRLYGEPVVKACVENGCDYLDICGEPEFMEKMEALYYEKAVERGVLVVSACGFDSIPAELGLMFNSRQWVGEGMLNNVEAYLNLESDKKIVGNFGTFESAVLGIANMDKLMELRKSRPKRASLKIPGSRPPKGPAIEHQKNLGLWAVRLPSADATVVRRTLTILAENPEGLPGVDESEEAINKRKSFWATVKPAYFGVKLSTKSPLGLITSITTGLFLGLFGKFSFGRWLLLKFPSLFSLGWFRKTGPTKAEVESASFKMWFVGRGYSNTGAEKPDMEIVTRVMGPEIGYVATPILIVQSALILLGKRGELPKGGVYPPGIVFGATDLQERLQENGISFDVVSKSSISA